jgi:transposase-like protein
MGELISERWIAARDDLKGRPDPQISYDGFASVCARHGLDETQTATLAGLLHDLGHIIHYAEDEGLRDVVVLQPEWLTKAIGYVLEDRKTEATGGVLSHARLKTIWQDPTGEESYPSVYHPYFLRLMEKFDVSYRIPDEDASLVAQLVRYQEPELIWRRDDDRTPWDRSTNCESPLPSMAGRRRLITMARRRHTPEQIIRKLREADRLLGEGAEIADVARHLEVSEQTYHRWRNQFGGMKADDAKRLKDLERENARLKKIVADKELEIDALREINRGNW